MRKIAGLLSVAALAAMAAPAGAAPSGGQGLVTETLDCGAPLGLVAITHGSGNSGWDVTLDTHYVVASFSSGEFSKSFGEKNGMSGLVTCSGDGFTVTAYPGPQGS
jgi:hypothetical protein